VRVSRPAGARDLWRGRGARHELGHRLSHHHVPADHHYRPLLLRATRAALPRAGAHGGADRKRHDDMSGRVARVAAHAKLNLFLRVLSREQDGYHSIETLFARIALADAVTVRVEGAARTIDCGLANVGPPEQNLAFRAAEAFRAARGWPRGFHIEIAKRIPVGGGLGGGRADPGPSCGRSPRSRPSPCRPMRSCRWPCRWAA